MNPTIAHLLAAKVPAALGMRVQPILETGAVGPEFGTVVGFMDTLPIVWWPDLLGTRAHHPTEHLLPDLADRATFLLCCDEIARRGRGPMDLNATRTWARWEVEPMRAGAIEAVAAKLAEVPQ